MMKHKPRRTCTCYLEASFTACDDREFTVSNKYGPVATHEWSVWDAEETMVCETHDKAHAELIAYALNKLGEISKKNTHSACRIHP